MSSERMQVGAWIAPLDPVESRQCVRAALRGETARVVERSPRMADGRRPLTPDGGGGLVELRHQDVEGAESGAFDGLNS